MFSKLEILLNLFLTLLVPLSIYSQADTNYFLTPSQRWQLIGEATIDDYQQCFGYGDFNGDNKSELVGNYSHSSIGLFIHNKDINGEWTKTVIHPKFNPANHIKGMAGSWPVKGFVAGDFDSDGLNEIITYADQIMYPSAHDSARYPFPGCIYIDWDIEQKKFIANPLIWGSWGENICSNKAAIQTVAPISSKFRSDGANSKLHDFLVRTMCNNVKDSRLFVLEQPEETFNSFDYRYITHDSIDTDTLYKKDAFYVHRFYVETQGGDKELYFSHTDSPFENVITASCDGNIFDYDNDGLFDLFVTISYYDKDSTFIKQQCGSSIIVYHRLPAKDGRKYRFEETFRKNLTGLTLGRPVAANLNGEVSDGKEGWVLPVHIDTSMKNDLNTAPGIVSVYKEGGEWLISGTYPDTTLTKKYIGVYSGVCVYDADGDGYDDAVIKLDICPKVVPYDTSKKFMTGDLKLFRNMRANVREYDELFSHIRQASQILWTNDAFTWDVHLEDFDDDGIPELGCALARREPAWCNTFGKFGIYYTELNWPPTDVNLLYNNHDKKLHRISPNPATNYINISTSSVIPAKAGISVDIKVYDMRGVCMLTQSPVLTRDGGNVRLDVSGIPNGEYIVVISSGNSKFPQKLIISK